MAAAALGLRRAYRVLLFGGGLRAFQRLKLKGYLLSQRADAARVHPHIMLPTPPGEKTGGKRLENRGRQRDHVKKNQNKLQGGGEGGG